MVIRPEELGTFTSFEKELLERVEAHIDAMLRKGTATTTTTVYFLNSFDYSEITDRVQEQITRRYGDAGWLVKWRVGICQRNESICQATFSPLAAFTKYTTMETLDRKCPHGRSWAGYCNDCLSDHDL